MENVDLTSTVLDLIGDSIPQLKRDVFISMSDYHSIKGYLTLWVTLQKIGVMRRIWAMENTGLSILRCVRCQSPIVPYVRNIIIKRT